MAEKLGLDPDKLEATVNEFNAACGPGAWDPARLDGKKSEGIDSPKSNWANPTDTPPFSAFPMTTHLTFTSGGVKVDTRGRVLVTNAVPIPGRYAAGGMTGLFYHEYPPATSVLRSNTFGCIIGTNLGKELAAREAH